MNGTDKRMPAGIRDEAKWLGPLSLAALHLAALHLASGVRRQESVQKKSATSRSGPFAL